jgi:hypothetical protein
MSASGKPWKYAEMSCNVRFCQPVRNAMAVLVWMPSGPSVLIMPSLPSGGHGHQTFLQRAKVRGRWPPRMIQTRKDSKVLD